MLNDLKRAVCKATKELARLGLVKFTWGTVSAFDPSMGLYVTCPEGSKYDDLQPEQMIVMSLDGQKVEGRQKVPYDVETHSAIYNSWAFTGIGAIVNTHSSYATSFAQAGLPIGAFGTTQLQVFQSDIPVTRRISPNEINDNYYANIGRLIVESIQNPMETYAVLVNQHGPYAWGKDCAEALERTIILEEIAKITYQTQVLNAHSILVDNSLRAFYNAHQQSITNKV